MGQGAAPGKTYEPKLHSVARFPSLLTPVTVCCVSADSGACAEHRRMMTKLVKRGKKNKLHLYKNKPSVTTMDGAGVWCNDLRRRLKAGIAA